MGFFQAFGLFSVGVLAGSVGLLMFLRSKLEDMRYCRTFLRSFADSLGKQIGTVARGDHTVDCWLCGWTNVTPRPMVTDDLLGELSDQTYRGEDD